MITAITTTNFRIVFAAKDDRVTITERRKGGAPVDFTLDEWWELIHLVRRRPDYPNSATWNDDDFTDPNFQEDYLEISRELQ